MADTIDVPVGPRGDAVRGSNDPNRRDVKFAGRNPDPSDTSPTASAEPERTDDGIPKFGGGGVRVRAKRDFWPKEQPDNAALAKQAKENDEPHVHREHRVRAGEIAEIPSDEAMDLAERGIIERVKDSNNGRS